MSASLPALQPPAGLQSNFDDPQSRISLTVIPCAAIVGLMIIFVFMRMYTKVYILKSVGWDDCTLGSVSATLQWTNISKIHASLQQYVKASLDVTSESQIALQISSVIFLGFLMACKSDPEKPP